MRSQVPGAELHIGNRRGSLYHELTYEEMARRTRVRIIYVLLAILIGFNLIIAFNFSCSVARTQGVTSLRDSIIEAAVQCCAVEGSYPSSIEHLEEDYGLVIDRDDYIVQYEYLGDNVPPSVVVKVK